MKERGNKLFKLVDKYLGSTLLFLLGITYNKRRPKDLSGKDCPRIAIIKTEAIGDTLLAGAAVLSIKKKWPQATITFICADNNAQAVKGLPGVAEIFVFHINDPVRSFWAAGKLQPFDLLVDFAPWARLNGLISCVIRARCRIGFKTEGMYRHYVYDALARHSSDLHELDNYQNLLKIIGIEEKLPDPFFKIDQSTLISGLEMPTDRTVVFHPFPGGAQKHLKSWPEANWIALGKALAREGYRVIISGGAGDQRAAGRIAEGIGRGWALSIAGRCDLNQTADIIKRSGCLISVDTGTMHLGAAVGAAVVSLHGPTAPERWGARGANVIPLRTKLRCSPCISLGFDSNCRSGRCMGTISVEEVEKTVIGLKKTCKS